MNRIVRKKWLIFAGIGCLMTDAGSCITIEAGIRKMQNNPWFWMETWG